LAIRMPSLEKCLYWGLSLNTFFGSTGAWTQGFAFAS
jgi:hypothetical protein